MYTPPQYPRRGGAGAGARSGVGGFNPVPLQNPPIPFPGVPQYYQNPPVPQQQFQNPNFHWPQNPLVSQQQFQNPNFHWPQNPYNQSLALPHSNPLQNPLPSINPYTQSPTFYQSDQSPNPSSTLDRIESAVSKAQHDLSVSGESISAWKVSQSALVALKADSWSSLGFQIQNIPFLHRLLIIEGKVNAFIHCFVGARRITSLYELEVAICKNEGIERFEELGLGPLTHHPLVEHYFSFSSNSGEICKITSEEIIKFMCAFIHKCKPKVDIEEFLDFIAKKKSVPVKKKLGVRIQSLGLHISYIREAKKAEKNILSKHLEVIKTGGSGGRKERDPSQTSRLREERDPSQTSRLVLEKHILDGRFDHISDRMKSFSSTWDDFGGKGKHIRFTCSDDDDDDDDVEEEEEEEKDPSFFQNQNSCHDKDSGRRVSNCPYPSTTEEIVRLGLKNETYIKTPLGYREILESGDEKSSGKKRKLVEKKDKSSSSCKLLKREHAFHLEKEKYFPDYILTWRNMEKFITTWKEACRELPLAKVLNRMLNFYRNSNTQDKKIKMVFMTYPFIGLLNVAVTSIKSGMLDSMYDTILAFDEHEFISPESGGVAEMIEIEEPSVKDISDSNISNEVVHSVSVDDIIKQVVKYYDINQLVSSGSNVSSGNQIAYLKMLCNCETRLIAQFSVKEFSSLGYGNFFKFLVKYASLLPLELQSFLSVNFNVQSRLEVSMLEQQLRVFLSQVESSTTDDDSITKDYVSMLLKKQFPTFSFCIVGNEAEKCFDELIKSQKDIDVGCVLFSTALLGKQTAFSITVSSKDAIECLLKAPMLADLLAWSHWDLLFAPSLGPLSDWLLNNGLYVKELLCIATVDGKLIRIDQSATADEFLEAMIQRSPFQVAVKLLSVVSLYKGLNGAPLSLLKCYAQRAFDIIIKNSVDSKVTFDEGINDNPLSNETTANGRALCKSLSRINDTVSAISSFILECLHYLPLEFRSFAADILISGLGSFTKDAPSIILLECRQLEQRLVLHDVGFSLGITEWIEDYYEFSKASADLSMSSKVVTNDDHLHTEISIELKDTPHVSEGSVSTNYIFDAHKRENNVAMEDRVSNKVSSDISEMIAVSDREVEEALHTIESIRHEEFGLDPNINYTESCLLRKQHARLGRALHCLSQELYSQDSHLLLELVQNADDNIYPENIDPTLVFIVQDTGIVVLNNEKGFSAKNIRALCDVGSSTKKGSGAGYIGNKGIGFKSVFRVTDAPEIHSNGFHVKFDITEGQIGFVLPTVISPCDIGMFKRMLSAGNDKSDGASWKTCILLPFRSKFREGVGLNSIVSMFSDLHPSLLLFLHRLQCIMFKNMLNDNLVVMRRETLGDGIVRVTHGEEIMSWLVVSKKLQASIFRQDVETTEIAMAFTLEEAGDGVTKSHLRQQPVFAFLPLRNYGLKFILQGDFVLPSSREEVDGDSAWNQWLLSEFPGLFVSAEQSFCSLPCFQENPGKAVTAYMNFVPLVGEVHGFFSHLPHMIISKLRTSSCLFLDGPELKWVLPCRGLRGWNEEARILLSDDLLQKHLGLCYLSKDVILSDPLAKALGVQDYGPKVLIEIISSICCANDGIKSLGLDWLSSWLAALYSILPVYSSGHFSMNDELEYDLINSLKNVPFVPLSDGSYSSMTEGPIWLPCDAFAIGFEGNRNPKEFQILYARLRIVNPLLFYGMNELKENSVLQMLRKIGVEQLSAHDVIKSHILVTLSGDTNTMEDTDMMIEYLTFIMLHFQHDCASCCSDKAGIIAELRKRPILLTNHGYKCPLYETIHFGREYGNPVDIEKLIGIVDIKWVEVDIAYLKHPTIRSSSLEMTKLRTFFQDLGVTDFVQVTRVDKNAPDITVSGSLRDGKDSVLPSIISDWESTELVNLLSVVSIKKHREQCICLLEILDKMWDDCYSASARGYIMSRTSEDKKAFDSSFLNCIREFQWIASSMDKELHFSKDLFHDCEEVRSMLGTMVPYAVPKVTSKMLLKDIGFKIQVSFDDALNMLHSWRVCKPPYKASIGQMAKLYTFIADEVSKSRIRSTEDFITSPFIFVPDSINSRQNVVSGVFVSPKEVYWTDPTGCVDRIHEMILTHTSLNKASCLQCNSLATVYPNLHDFFVNVCGVQHFPSFASYLQILLQLSTVTLPSEAAHLVFRVLLRWVDDIKSGLVKPEEVSKLKEELIKLENTVLPTLEDKWVSLHPSFGIVCWSDDEKLKQQFKHFDGVYFLQFGELNSDENKMLSGKVAKLLGVPALSEIVTREAIFYGTVDDKEKAALINWVLPYAQRYLHKLHPEIYLNLKQLGFEKLSHMKVVVVDKLFYKHTLKAHESTSKKRWECSCLLQGNIFYATQLSDPHSMFLELSRFFFNGSVELHLANFLHMVTAMAESGSSSEQTELFIINNQKVPMLPDEEPIWSFSSPLELSEHRTQLPSSSASSEQKELTTKRKPGISANWPPRDWRTAPGFDYARANHYLTYGVSQEYSKAPETLSHTENITVPVEIDWTREEEMLSTNTLVLQGSEMIDDKPHEPVRSNTVNRQIGLSAGPKIESFDSFIDTKRDMGVTNPLTSSEDWIYLQTPEENQATRRTGRLGEMVAYKYFSERLGSRNVKWINESIETGLPYDLVIVDDKGGIREYIEVKSTKSASKDWFEISTREWQFAAERGDSFSIAHVILVAERKAMVTVMRNPVKLCQQNGLQLAILMSRKLRENFGFDSVNT